ncbi:MAG: ATP-dependent helicase HrpB [Alphaproteobacteria bacterium]|nr:ATP-dependent helicase HrpB [Alphaproteobacteria bacterium]MDE2012430.1 ATP-dependent helicase HrpB [Alphaproteobacteria bacterium]MDE2072068.1 ATP-dependent helicase HrpB [Alphaproteobacteria bacterium]
MPLPHFTIPDLPITDCLPRLLAALGGQASAVLVAPPGAGKTTCVPLALLQSAPTNQGCILMLEPRRLAARAAASRMAALIGEKVGRTVGFRTRLESAISSVTRIEVVTTGLFVRRLIGDPGLEGVSAVILDEIHERSLEADLALALCLDAQAMLRPELRLLAMSATLDGARLSAIMDAPIIESAGRIHPVEVRHAARDIQHLRDLPQTMARAIRAALAEAPGDILAFLPGMAEIRRTEAALDGIDAAVLPLHGDLPPAAQDQALRPTECRRVVLATAIAETSLTVPGVRIVIDGGFRRAPRFDPASGLTRLATERVSRAVADQRAGRAGRETPGIAIRLWTEAAQRGLRPYDRPEILDAELSGLVLDCAAWGTPPGKLAFLDAPPEGAIATAGALLTELGAMDNTGGITALGMRMNRLGAHPRLSAMMLATEDPALAARACDISALLEGRDPLGAGLDTPVDIMARLEAMEDPSAVPGVDRNAIHGIRQAAKQYRRRLGIGVAQAAAGDPAPLIAAAFPDRLAQRRSEPGSFRLSGGGSARLALTDPLAKASLLAVAALEMKTSPRICMAAPLDVAKLPAVLAARINETVETSLDPATGSILSRRRKRLGALVLEERSAPPDAAGAAAVLLEAVRKDPSRLPWTDGARNLQARLSLMHALEADIWPASDDRNLIASLEEWLGPHLYGRTRLADLTSLDLHAILLERLDWPLRKRLDQELPTHLPLPRGKAQVDYTEPVPIAAARAQHFYGLAVTPKLAGGRVPLRLALLSPAGRPIALTADIAGFWNGAWADVRRDMRGRYPKHNWPENPLLP